MPRFSRRIAFAALLVSGCGTPPAAEEASLSDLDGVRSELVSRIEASGAEVGLYYRSLGPSRDSIVLGGDIRMHAASTMKVPVMMKLFRDHESGRRSLDSTLPVRRTFRSIVDGSEFDLPPESDSDTKFYGRVGEEAPIREMIDRMITRSSNLATNILIETADPVEIGAMLAEVGADSMQVLRGVEDLKAFEAGLSNTTTARSLGHVMVAVANGEGFDPESRDEMIEIMERQHFRENIPAGLPEGTRVANKTGWITGINHDAAIVFPESAPPYVLVIMLRGHPADDSGTTFAAALSGIVWEAHAEASR